MLVRIIFKHISSNPDHHMKCWQWYKWQWLCRKQLQSSFWYFATNIDDVIDDLKERSHMKSLLISKIHTWLKIRNNDGNSNRQKRAGWNLFKINILVFHAPMTQRFREVFICFLSLSYLFQRFVYDWKFEKLTEIQQIKGSGWNVFKINILVFHVTAFLPGISLIWYCFNMIYVPARLNDTECWDKFSVLSTKSSRRSPRSIRVSTLATMISLTRSTSFRTIWTLSEVPASSPKNTQFYES